MGGKKVNRLLAVKYSSKKMFYIFPRKILQQNDIRPGTKKGKIRSDAYLDSSNKNA